MSEMNFTHKPVLLKEVLELLPVISGGYYMDGTIGLGGHAEALLEAAPESSVIGFDRDPEMLTAAMKRLERFGGRVKGVNANFTEAGRVLKEQGIGGLSGALLDLGVSSLHYDKASRGFSIKLDGPLDMRLDPGNPLTAAEIVNYWPFDQLAENFRKCGERNAARIASAIVRRRADKFFTSTSELGQFIAENVPYSPSRIHPATKVFLALRITVNGELDNAEKGIAAVSAALVPGGRLAVITFHSLEDRLVKNCFARLTVDGSFKAVTHKAVRPGPEEVEGNPRARSAQLRVIERI